MKGAVGKNPLQPLALVAVFSISWDIYDLVFRHHANSIAILRMPLFFIFVVFYLLNSRGAWVAAVIAFIAIAPLYLIGEYVRSELPSLSVVVIFTVATVGGILFLISIRQRYDSYLEQQRSGR